MYGMLIDYHLIFMILSLGLFFGSIFLIWLMETKQAVQVAIFLTSINQLFLMITVMGFFSIGYIGVNETTGGSEVIAYTDLQFFYLVFFMLMWINSLLLIIAIFKYMRKVHEMMQEELELTSY